MWVPFGRWWSRWSRCRWGTLGTHVGSGSTGLSRRAPVDVAPDETEEDRVDDLLGGQHLPVGDAGMAAGEGEQPDAVHDIRAGHDEAVLVADEQPVDRLEQGLV